MHRFRANGFTSETLDGWEDRSTLTLVGPTSADGFAANLVVTRQALPAGASATDFGRTQAEALAAEVDELVTEDERTVHRDGRELFQRLHRFRVGDRPIRQVQTYLVCAFSRGCVCFVITGSASPDAFDGVMPAFARFVERFEPVDPDDVGG